MQNPVGWFEIYVNDLARAKAFYEAVFEVTFEALDAPSDDNLQMLAFPSDMQQYGATGALVKMDHFQAGIGGTLVYFACDDCANEEARVVTAGGTIQKPKTSIGEYGFMSLVSDSEGNMIGLHSMQ